MTRHLLTLTLVFLLFGVVSGQNTNINLHFKDMLGGAAGQGCCQSACQGGSNNNGQVSCPVGDNFIATYQALWNPAPGTSAVTASMNFNAHFAPNGTFVLGSHGFKTTSDSATRVEFLESIFNPLTGSSVIVTGVFCSETDPNSFVLKWLSTGVEGYDIFTLDANGKILLYFETDPYVTIDCESADNFVPIYTSLWNSQGTAAAFAQDFNALFATNGALVLGSHADESANTSAARIQLFEKLFGSGTSNVLVSVSEVFCSESNPNSFVLKWVDSTGPVGFDSFVFDDNGDITFYYETDALVF